MLVMGEPNRAARAQLEAFLSPNCVGQLLGGASSAAELQLRPDCALRLAAQWRPRRQSVGRVEKLSAILRALEPLETQRIAIRFHCAFSLHSNCTRTALGPMHRSAPMREHWPAFSPFPSGQSSSTSGKKSPHTFAPLAQRAAKLIGQSTFAPNRELPSPQRALTNRELAANRTFLADEMRNAGSGSLQVSGRKSWPLFCVGPKQTNWRGARRPESVFGRARLVCGHSTQANQQQSCPHFRPENASVFISVRGPKVTIVAQLLTLRAGANFAPPLLAHRQTGKLAGPNCLANFIARSPNCRPTRPHLDASRFGLIKFTFVAHTAQLGGRKSDANWTPKASNSPPPLSLIHLIIGSPMHSAASLLQFRPSAIPSGSQLAAWRPIPLPASPIWWPSGR